MAKHTQSIRRQYADELFECVWPFRGSGAYKFRNVVDIYVQAADFHETYFR